MRPTLPFPSPGHPGDNRADAAFNFEDLTELVNASTQRAQEALSTEHGRNDLDIDLIVGENVAKANEVLSELTVPNAADNAHIPNIDFGGHGPFGDEDFFLG